MMSFSLSKPWTNSDVAALLGSVQDDRHWRIIIDKSGNVSLLDASAHSTPFEQLHGYFEIYSHGTGHAGPDAAADAAHVNNIATDLRDNWPTLKGDACIDH
jgi:hypothetical protein